LFGNAGIPKTVPSSDPFNTVLQLVNKIMVHYERAVMQFVEALLYKLEGRGFDSR